MKKFELFMGCLGNGITICNKAAEENGDYKIIAHIRECGKIKWYVNPYTYVSGNELLKIEHAANVQAEKWEKWFNSLSVYKQYEFLLDNVPYKILSEILQNKNLDLLQKIQILKKRYYEIA